MSNMTIHRKNMVKVCERGKEKKEEIKDEVKAA